jgi:predicted SAM-dependent methyltransferase
MKNFDEKQYLKKYTDVAIAVEKGVFKNGYEHYIKHGKHEKRSLGIYLSKEEKVFKLLKKKGKGLEIGPSHNPLAPKREGFNVQILDHASTADLKKKYKDHGVNIENIEEVDFVWNGEPLNKLIQNTHCYDYIIASHVIEHIPDFISFLRQIELLLKPDGILSLVVPDKRYCFDYFSPISSSGKIIDAYLNQNTQPSPGQVFDHFSNASMKENNIAWSESSKVESYELCHSFDDAKEFYKKSLNEKKDYIDVHCWRFIPESFSLIIKDLQMLGLINLEIKQQFDTTGCEFFASLGRYAKNSKAPKNNRLNILQSIKLS